MFAGHDAEHGEHATKDETHAPVHASFEAPLMTAAMSPTPAPVSPFGDSAAMTHEAAPAMMSASLGVGGPAVSSPFGSPDEDIGQPGDMSAR